MTVRLKDFLAAFDGYPPNGLVDFMLIEPGANTELVMQVALHPQSTLGDPGRDRFTLMFVRLDQ